jgi:hypothetical protein
MQMPCGLWVWPIPHVHALLQSIDQDKRISPVWMTSWGKKAHDWNEYTQTSYWEIGYPCLDPDVSGKPLAIQHYLHRHKSKSAVWIEDGFSAEDKAWSVDNGVLLLDTLKDSLRYLLLCEDDKAIHYLIDMIVDICIEAKA